MIDYVVGLCDNGYGYETDDGIYYDISKFKDYGALSGNSLEELKSVLKSRMNEHRYAHSLNVA